MWTPSTWPSGEASGGERLWVSGEGVWPVEEAEPERQFPATLAAWESTFPGLPSPIGLWSFQDAAAPVVDGVGANDLLVNSGVWTFGVASDPEPASAPRDSVRTDAGSTNNLMPALLSFGNVPAGGARFLLVRFACPDNGATNSGVAGKGSSGGGAHWALRLVATTGQLRARLFDGTNAQDLDSANAYDDDAYHDVIFGVDGGAADRLYLITESEDLSAALTAALKTTIDGAGLAPGNGIRFGHVSGNVCVIGLRFSYAALFDVPLTAADLATFRSLL